MKSTANTDLIMGPDVKTVFQEDESGEPAAKKTGGLYYTNEKEALKAQVALAALKEQ